MTPIQRKALEHIQNLLLGYDNYSIYSGLVDEMTRVGIDNETRSIIMKTYNELDHKCKKPLSEARTWIQSILDDSKK
jgi:hypothetical protein